MSTDRQRKTKAMARRLKVLSQQVRMFQEAMQGMRAGSDLDTLLKVVITSVCKGMGFRRGGVFLADPDFKHIRLAMGMNRARQFEKANTVYPIRPKAGFNDHSDLIFRHKKYLLSNNVLGRYKEGLVGDEVILNMALVPIYAGPGRPIGDLAVDNMDHYRHITKADVKLLFDYSTLVGLIIQSARHYKNAVEQAVTDPMTGLGNRRAFESALEQEVKRAQRYKKKFSLLIGDIDLFKKVNDTYGHDVGDKVIKHIAQVLKGGVRNIDLVARIGGEEFAVLLPELSGRSCQEVAKRLLDRTRRSTPPQPVPSVTVSLGMVTYLKGAVTAAQLFKMADKSLYQAKRGGRDRCGSLHLFSGR